MPLPSWNRMPGISHQLYDIDIHTFCQPLMESFKTNPPYFLRRFLDFLKLSLEFRKSLLSRSSCNSALGRGGYQSFLLKNTQRIPHSVVGDTGLKREFHYSYRPALNHFLEYYRMT